VKIKGFLFVVIWGWFLLMVVMGGHYPDWVMAQDQAGQAALRVERIGVMPFFKGRCGSEVRETLDCPIGMLSFDPESLSIGCDQTLTGYVHGIVQKRHGEKVVPLREGMEVYARMDKDEFTDTPRTTAQSFGRALGANFIVAGWVWRYRERIGGDIGVQSPASVAFTVALIDVKSGKMLWQGKFVEKQSSLSENIVEIRKFLKRSGKWLSVDELARYGVREVFTTFPM
jgi:hypothetical protein